MTNRDLNSTREIDNPGANDGPSIIAIVVQQVICDIGEHLYGLPENEVVTHVTRWLEGVQSDSYTGRRIILLLQANPGWGKLIGRRVFQACFGVHKAADQRR